MTELQDLADWPCQKYNPPHDCGRITGNAPLPCGPCTARAALAANPAPAGLDVERLNQDRPMDWYVRESDGQRFYGHLVSKADIIEYARLAGEEPDAT